MKTFGEYLNDFKALQGFATDKELADYFGVTGNYITNARRSGNFSDERCVEVARALGDEEYLVLISRNMLKETGEMREVWAKAAKRIGGTLAIAGIMTGLSVLTADQVSTEVLPEIMSMAEVPQVFITGIIVLMLMNIHRRFNRAFVARLNSFFCVFSKRKETALNVANWYVASKCFSISYSRP